MKRRDKINYYLDIAETVLERGTCIRRNFGAVIVKNDQIISTGYTGSPRGRTNCSDTGKCARQELKVPKGQRYELCKSVHAEANAIIDAARNDMIGATLYLAGHDAETGEILAEAEPCLMCKRLIINAGINTVIIRVTKDEFKTVPVSNWIENEDEGLTTGY